MFSLVRGHTDKSDKNVVCVYWTFALTEYPHSPSASPDENQFDFPKHYFNHSHLWMITSTNVHTGADLLHFATSLQS